MSYLDAKSILPCPDSVVPDNAFGWLDELFAGIESAYQHDIPAMEPLSEYFLTFVWMARFEFMECQEFLDHLASSPKFHLRFSRILLHWNDWPYNNPFIPYALVGLNADEYKRPSLKPETYLDPPLKCSGCKIGLDRSRDVAYYNAMPLLGKRLRYPIRVWVRSCARTWCKECRKDMVKSRSFPWRE